MNSGSRMSSVNASAAGPPSRRRFAPNECAGTSASSASSPSSSRAPGSAESTSAAWPRLMPHAASDDAHTSAPRSADRLS